MLVSGSTERPPLPTTGMRGGLGRTLLTAFLILAIVPLSTISWYATVRARRDIQYAVTAKLSSIAQSIEAQVRWWAEDRVASLALLAGLPATQESTNALIGQPSQDALTEKSPASSETIDGVSSRSIANAARDTLRDQLLAVMKRDPAFRRLAVLDGEGRVLVSTDLATEGALIDLWFEADPETGQLPSIQFITLDPTANVGLIVAAPMNELPDQALCVLVGWINLKDLIANLQTTSELGETGEVYLVDASGMGLPQGRELISPGIEMALSGESEAGLQTNYADIPVIGVYRWIPDLKLALVAEQAQEEAFATNDSVTAAFVGATLIVALATAIIAAIVTRQITRPVVQLTESALMIAGGELEQRVPVASRDEIGILAYVFNRMATELKALYDDLEAKVAQRTALLQRANYQIQRRAIQMQASLEVGQAVTYILDPDDLLDQIVQVVRNRFVYSYAAVYTVAEGKDQLVLRASDGKADPYHGELIPVDLPGPVGRAFREGVPVAESHLVSVEIGPPASYTRAEVALPLCLGEQTLGVLDVQSTGEEDFDQDDIYALQSVTHQITIALENARAYAVELEAVKRLQELDRSKRRFLANMSHELRTPLTNIIGFSKLLMKGISGPLTEQQIDDLQIIYRDSQHLLGLINDLLDISHIEAGLVELEFQQVDLADLIDSVMSTASALVRDKDVELRQEIPADLPTVQADRARIRQVLLRLLANAAKFTQQGTITVHAWPTDGEVQISVNDTGVGIPPEDQGRIFERFEQGTLENGRRPNGAGLGLALSKEFVEMHGGRIWVESEVGQGATFTFALPLGQ